jgi:2'-5' RNA ligase
MASDIHRLFFAAHPHASVLDAIGRAAAKLREAKLIRGRWTQPAKYHLTLRFLGDFREPVADIITQASAAAATLRATPFEVVLDRVTTFRGRFQAPCVLRCAPASEQAVRAVWSALGDALADLGADHRIDNRFIAHVTIAYGDRMLQEPIAIEPIVWRVDEFTLMDSHKSQYRVEARWPLAT